MKKLLLGTTGLVAATLVASAASAQTPKVTIGGFADFQAGYISDDLDANQRSHSFRNDTEVSIRVDGKSEAGLGYGAVIDLEADVTADANGEGLNAARTYVYLDGNWGRFELGSNEGPAETMRVDASSLAAATGGIDGDWVFFANNAAGGFITTPSLPLAHGSVNLLNDESVDNANKITYYSPRYYGFQLGAAYQPDSGDRGQLTKSGENTIGQFGETVDLGLNYEGTYDAVSFAAAATAQFGDAEANQEDLMAYNGGVLIGFAGFHLAGSYGEWEGSVDTSLASVANNAEGDYWTAGGGYDFGPFGASLTYLNSTYELGAVENDFENYVAGVDYKLAPGLTPYAEVSVYEFDGQGTAGDNDGTVVIIGTQVAF